jgi:cyanophycinase
METIGSNLVIIMDGHKLEHNNAAAIPKGTAISIENMLLHALVKGNVYDVTQREFYPSHNLRIQATEPVAMAAEQSASQPTPAN